MSQARFLCAILLGRGAWVGWLYVVVEYVVQTYKKTGLLICLTRNYFGINVRISSVAPRITIVFAVRYVVAKKYDSPSSSPPEAPEADPFEKGVYTETWPTVFETRSQRRRDGSLEAKIRTVHGAGR